MQVYAQAWEKFCIHIGRDPYDALASCQAQLFQQYLHWILDRGSVQRLNSLITNWNYIRMLYRDKNGQRDIDPIVGKHITNYIKSSLKDEYELSTEVRTKPDMSVEDLRFALRHHWAYDQELYSTERQRVQMSLMLLLCAYTGSRPGAIIESGCARGSNRALRYRDVELMLIPNPQSGGRDLWVMKVTLVFRKGDCESANPQTFTIHEDDDPAFCPVLQFLALAFADRAFEASNLQSAQDLRRVRIDPPLMCQIFHWKESILDIPVFRQAKRVVGGIMTSPDRAWQYDSFQPSLRILGKATGFKHPITVYSIRRETGNIMNAVSEHERKQVMGHKQSDTFDRNYLSQHVRRDVQALYRRQKEHQVVQIAVQMSTYMDPRAPYKLTKEQRAMVKKHPKIVKLRQMKTASSRELRQMYGSMPKGKGTELYDRYYRLKLDLDSEEKFQESLMERDLRDQYFKTVHTTALERQLSVTSTPSTSSASTTSSPSYIGEETPTRVEHLFQERTRVADALFFSSKDITEQELLEHRINIISDLTALCFLRETQNKRSSTLSKADRVAKEEVDEEKIEELIDPNLFPLVCPSTQCLFCLGNECLSYGARTYSFSRTDALRKHVQTAHLRYLETGDTVTCPHPVCEVKLEGIMHFKNHVATVHNIFL
ncbi:MAG: hypothetical protein M1840_007924 [Geoglossum simile]|nr:MAG: hypothetical protein M1840_007924 [Geoglossum simile]